ncbi:glycosyltransferase family 2 protein [Mycobacterium alsense]|uniref:glycosyltransferase family 2 protein n=1 Tax=Mycobacterium alsense TaxID=324058 RepID=UPI000A759BE9|nr:glycosyltransferase family 2 protein [Mycobacterium alsense]
MTTNRDNHAPTKPTVSVCVPMYNNSATIERCLRSILDQDGVEFEILVCDDNSSDDCAAIAASLLRPGDRLIRNQPNLGLNGNHNKCIDLARGSLIQFVHGDDWLLPGALRTLVPCFEDPAVGMAFAPRRVINQKDVPLHRRLGPAHIWFPWLRKHNHGPSLVAQMMLQAAMGNWIGEPTCVMFRRQLGLDVGGLRDDIYQLVDLDFWLRLMLRCDVCFVRKKLSVRIHSAGTTTLSIVKARRNWLDHLRILTWLIVDPASPRVVRTTARVWWVLKWAVMWLGVAVLGPERRSRLKLLADAPTTEFARARQLADKLA